MWPITLMTVDIRKEFRRLHGMELTSCRLIGNLIENDPPEAMRARLKEHLRDTQWQVKLVKSCAELLGETGKESLQLPMQDLWGTCSGFGALLAYKKFEISNYQSALVVARKTGICEIADICQELLDCEKSFSSWLQKQVFKNAWIPTASPKYLAV